MGLPPLNCQSAQSSLVAHPSDVPIEFILKSELGDRSTPPAQKPQPRASYIDQSPRGRGSLADRLPLPHDVLECRHVDAVRRIGFHMLSEPQKLIGLYT